MGAASLLAMITTEYVAPRLLPGIWLEMIPTSSVPIQTLKISCLGNYKSFITGFLIFLKPIFFTIAGLFSIIQSNYIPPPLKAVQWFFMIQVSNPKAHRADVVSF